MALFPGILALLNESDAEEASSNEVEEQGVVSSYSSWVSAGTLSLFGQMAESQASESAAASSTDAFDEIISINSSMILTQEGASWLGATGAGQVTIQEPESSTPNLISSEGQQVVSSAEPDRGFGGLLQQTAEETTPGIQFDPSNPQPIIEVSASNFDPRASRVNRATARGEPSVAPETEEEFGGPDGLNLTAAEKPQIVAIIEEDISPNGYPRQVTLIVKKLLSIKYKPIAYRLYKKSVFTDTEYSKISDVLPESLVATRPSARYHTAIRNAGFKLTDVFTYTDTDIDPGRVYAYKLRLRFSPDPEAIEAIETIGQTIAGVAAIRNARS